MAEDILKTSGAVEVIPTTQNIDDTVAGVKTSSYLTKSGVYAGSVIDEIIEINITLADVFSFVGNKRKFAFFGEVFDGGDLVELDRGNINDYIIKLTNQNTIKILQTWFNSGGQAITIINMNTILEEKTVDFEAKNLILAGLQSADQLIVYDMYKLLNKRIFLTKNKNDDFEAVAKSRDVAIFLIGNLGTIEEDLPIFEYYAKYTNQYFFKKNNFENSLKFKGQKIETINYLISNNIGCLMVLEDNNPSIYYNMVDNAGYDVNLGFLKDDLVNKIQINNINCLKVNNQYNQSTINRLDASIKKAALFFVELGKIGDFKQTLIPFNKQQTEDIKNGVVKGFTLKYQALTEIKRTQVNLIEVIGNLEE